jgi:hypothetical protein
MGQLRRGEGWSGEFLVQRRDGTTFMAHVSASLIQDDTTTLISIVAMTRDSTAQQQLQEANRLLAEASARLASAVDYEAQLTTLAQLAVPQLADWCAVHLLQADGSIEQVAVARAETGHAGAHDWLQNYLPLTTWMGCRPCYATANRSWFRRVPRPQAARRRSNRT